MIRMSVFAISLLVFCLFSNVVHPLWTSRTYLRKLNLRMIQEQVSFTEIGVPCKASTKLMVKNGNKEVLNTVTGWTDNISAVGTVEQEKTIDDWIQKGLVFWSEEQTNQATVPTSTKTLAKHKRPRNPWLGANLYVNYGRDRYAALCLQANSFVHYVVTH